MPITPFFAICNQKVAGSIPAAGTKKQGVAIMFRVVSD